MPFDVCRRMNVTMSSENIGPETRLTVVRIREDADDHVPTMDESKGNYYSSLSLSGSWSGT